MKPPFNGDAAANCTRLSYLLGPDVANTAQRPRCNEGDLFGELLGK